MYVGRHDVACLDLHLPGNVKVYCVMYLPALPPLEDSVGASVTLPVRCQDHYRYLRTMFCLRFRVTYTTYSSSSSSSSSSVIMGVGKASILLHNYILPLWSPPILLRRLETSIF